MTIKIGQDDDTISRYVRNISVIQTSLEKKEREKKGEVYIKTWFVFL